MNSTRHTDSSLPVEGASCGQRRDLLTRWFFLGIATAAYIGSITGVLGATVTTRSYDKAIARPRCWTPIRRTNWARASDRNGVMS